MVSLPPAPDLQEGLFCISRSFANVTLKQATSTQQAWKLQPQTTTTGGSPSRRASRQVKKGERNCGKRCECADDDRKQNQHPQSQPQTTPAGTATEAATQESGCSATAGDANQPSTNPWCILHCLTRQEEAAAAAAAAAANMLRCKLTAVTIKYNYIIIIASVTHMVTKPIYVI